MTAIDLSLIRHNGKLRLAVKIDGEVLVHLFPCEAGREVDVPSGGSVPGAIWAHDLVWAHSPTQVFGPVLTKSQRTLVREALNLAKSVPVTDTLPGET